MASPIYILTDPNDENVQTVHLKQSILKGMTLMCLQDQIMTRNCDVDLRVGVKTSLRPTIYIHSLNPVVKRSNWRKLLSALAPLYQVMVLQKSLGKNNCKSCVEVDFFCFSNSHFKPPKWRKKNGKKIEPPQRCKQRLPTGEQAI